MPECLPTLISLRAFEAAARNLSVKRASEELNVTPTAVSHQLRKLEEDLGIKLVRRVYKGIEVTDSGKQLMGSLSLAFNQIERAVSAVRVKRNGRTLRIRAQPALLSNRIIRVFGEFQSDMPDIDIELMPALKPVLDKDVDAIIAWGQPSDWPECRARPIMTSVFRPYCSAEYLKQRGPFKHPDDLRNEQLFIEQDYEDEWSSWFHAVGTQWHPVPNRLVVPDVITLISQTINGNGIGLFQTKLIEEYVDAGVLIEIFSEGFSSDRVYHFITRSIEADSEILARFHSCLISKL